MTKFKSIPVYDRPRERLYNLGSENLTDEELLSIIIKTGTKGVSVKEVSLNLLSSIDNITKLKTIGINSLMKIPGIGKVKAIEIKAAIELGKRIYNENSKNTKLKLNNSIIIYENFKYLFKDKYQEYFYSIYVDTKTNYISKKCLFIGTINNSVIHPREIFKEAYMVSANGIICMHNHPSGDPTPSKEDILVTNKLREIGILHGIKIIDHIIFGNNNYYSFFENKKL